MSMRINTNLDALTAQRNLATTGLAYSKSVQKLSSGMRINSAPPSANLKQRSEAILPLLNQVASTAYQLSLSPKQVLSLLEPLLKEREND